MVLKGERGGGEGESLTVSTSSNTGLILNGEDWMGDVIDLNVGEFLDPASSELARGYEC